MRLTKTENSLEAYLSEKTETAQGLNVMNEQFASFASARIMISNVTYEDAKMLYDQIVEVEGVSMVNFNNSNNYYKDAKALMSISFEYERFDERTEKALADIKGILKDYDVTYDTKVGYYPTEDVANQMKVIVVLQLALAVDYAIIMIHRYSSECEHYDRREACIKALTKAIPEISSSSLTTICGLSTLAFM